MRGPQVCLGGVTDHVSSITGPAARVSDLSPVVGPMSELDLSLLQIAGEGMTCFFSSHSNSCSCVQMISRYRSVSFVSSGMRDR
jgi:hypothetical protein